MGYEAPLRFFRLTLACLLSFLATAATADQTSVLLETPQPVASSSLQTVLNRIVSERLATNKPSLSPQQVHVAVIDLVDPAHPVFAEYNGYLPVYPASVVKMFYMGCVYFLAKRGEIAITKEVYDKQYQMIRRSSNAATAWIVDLWSGIKHDGAMTPAQYELFARKRNVCNVWLRSLGLTGINACQKTWVTPIPPGEEQFLRDGRHQGPYTNRNTMTAMAAARYLQLVAQEVLVDAETSRTMKRLMRRDVREQPYQRRRIAGGAPDGADVYSKSGTTTQTFHDAGIVKLRSGRTYILVVLITAKGDKGTFIRDVSADVGRYFEE